MKTTTLITALLLPFISSALSASIPVSSVTRDTTVHDVSADGLYRVTVDSQGNTQTEFTPYDEIANLTSSTSTSTSNSIEARSTDFLEKRREGCGPGSTNANDADEANKCLVNGFAPGDVYLNKGAWTYCVRNDVVSFVCPYSGGYKPRDSIQGTMDYVKRNCGKPPRWGTPRCRAAAWAIGRPGRYARTSDHFCDKNFHVGN